MGVRAWGFAVLTVAATACGVYNPARLDASRDGRTDADASADALRIDADATTADIAADVPPDTGCPACDPGMTCCARACVMLSANTMHCGRCGNACPNTTCASGACTNSCVLGFGDCDRNAINGCEIDLGTSTDHCGRCASACSLPNASVACTAGRCEFVRCNPGFADCNMDPTDGCEVNTNTSVQNCGACGNACMATGGMPACRAGACGLSTCAAGRGDCDSNEANGCESDIRTDLMNCGGCGMNCAPANAAPVCAGGLCGLSRCNVGFANCDAMAANGCEVDTQSNPLHCGMCSRACVLPNAATGCMDSACTVAACAPNFANCDTIVANGCEVDTRTSVANCGACGAMCTLPNATASCMAATCAITTCTAGFGNCDMLPANGCEVALSTTATDCGRCGNACAAGVRCTAGVCEDQWVTRLDAGGGHVCALRANNTLACWGYNLSGQVGDGTAVSRSMPTTVMSVSDATNVTASHYRHTCARRTSGAVACWGYNAFGGLGNGTVTGSMTPVAVSGLADATQVSGGYRHTCARRMSGAVACWGYNAYGQLGNGTLVQSLVPVPVTGLVDAVEVTTGQYHSCARRATGAVVCWGYGLSGQMGNGLNANAPVPVAVAGLLDAVEISAGALFTCARRATGAIACWGQNDMGQLAQNPLLIPSRPTPLAIAGIADAVQITGGQDHNCVRRMTGIVSCWGGNATGQIGNGTVTMQLAPVAVTGLADATDVAAGWGFTCAQRATHAIVCWGSNAYGQIGDGTLTTRPTPTTVMGLP